MANEKRRLDRFTDLKGSAIAATDGAIGEVEDVYFDDQSWTVRYVVVDTGGWLSGRKVLVAPNALKAIDTRGKRLMSDLSRRQVEESPSVDTAKPVSRQYETEYLGHYGYPPYWEGPYRWGLFAFPDAIPMSMSPAAALPTYAPRVAEELAARERANADPNLRSARHVSGYSIQATDGALGHVEDYLIDEREWAIRYVIVDPRSWWPGEHVVISPEWITTVDWNESKVHVDVTKETVRNAPSYRPELDHEYESALYAHYRRPGYWDRRPEEWRRRGAA